MSNPAGTLVRTRHQKPGRCMQKSTFGWRRAVRQQKGGPRKNRALWGLQLFPSTETNGFFLAFARRNSVSTCGFPSGTASHSIPLDRCKLLSIDTAARGIESRCCKTITSYYGIVQHRHVVMVGVVCRCRCRRNGCDPWRTPLRHLLTAVIPRCSSQSEAAACSFDRDV